MSIQELDIELINEILTEHYSIGKIIDYEFIRCSFNEHYKITTKDNQYVLRVYLDNKYYINSIDDIKAELEVIDFLDSRSISVGNSILNNYGERLSFTQNDSQFKNFALFKFIEGNPIKTSLDFKSAKSFGTNIAKMHLALDSFENRLSRYMIDFTFLIEEPLKVLIENATKFDLKVNTSIIDIINHTNYKLQALMKNKEMFGLVHGDLNPSNILVNDNAQITFLDFDHLADGLKIHDLCVVFLCFDSDTFDNVLEGYLTKRLLSDEEVKLIPLYSYALILRKYMDILSVEEFMKKNKKFNIRKYTLDTITYLEEMYLEMKMDDYIDI